MTPASTRIDHNDVTDDWADTCIAELRHACANVLMVDANDALFVFDPQEP